MPTEFSPEIEITAFAWVPPFARGQVRDLRVRWALEEIGLPYRTRLLGGERPADYFEEQPWGQVPAFREGEVRLFESGAIVLHIGEKDERLLPREAPARGRAICWLIAALNSVEPSLGALVEIDLFAGDAAWAKLARPGKVTQLAGRLAPLETRMAQRDWLEDRFTVGDLMMIAVLRSLTDQRLREAHPALAAYIARGEARPAFQRALAAQLADFIPDPL